MYTSLSLSLSIYIYIYTHIRGAGRAHPLPMLRRVISQAVRQPTFHKFT